MGEPVLAAAPTEAKPATQQASGERDKERDAWLGGSSYEAAMLRELLANIHRDGGHYVARHGLEKALSDAHAVIIELRCAALSTPAQQDAVDAERYRLLRRGQHWSVIDGIGNVLRGDDLDAAINAKKGQP